MVRSTYFEQFCFTIVKMGYKIPDEIVTAVNNNWFMEAFLNAPASTKYHGSFRGGLALHTYCVLDEGLKLFDKFRDDHRISMETFITAVFWHDIGKLGLIHRNGKVIEPYYIFKDEDTIIRNDNISLPHQELSAINYSNMVENPSYDMLHAIRYHNMLYTDSIKVIKKETPLLLLLHWADMYASRYSLLEGSAV